MYMYGVFFFVEMCEGDENDETIVGPFVSLRVFAS